MEERRQFVRLGIDVDVSWEKSTVDKSVDSVSGAKTKNISAGGVCLIVDDPISVGDQLKIKFQLPNQLVIEAVGVVLWASEFGIGEGQGKKYDTGIQFLEISENDVAQINKFVFGIKPNK